MSEAFYVWSEFVSMENTRQSGMLYDINCSLRWKISAKKSLQQLVANFCRAEWPKNHRKPKHHLSTQWVTIVIERERERAKRYDSASYVQIQSAEGVEREIESPSVSVCVWQSERVYHYESVCVCVCLCVCVFECVT